MPTQIIDTGKQFHRVFKAPLDSDLIFTTLQNAVDYVEDIDSSAYHGQLLTVADGITHESMCYRVDWNGTNLYLSPVIVSKDISIEDAIMSGGILEGTNFPDLTDISPTSDIINRINDLTHVLTNNNGEYNHRPILTESYPDLLISATQNEIITRINVITNALIIREGIPV